jgi:hypothetical protein
MVLERGRRRGPMDKIKRWDRIGQDMTNEDNIFLRIGG